MSSSYRRVCLTHEPPLWLREDDYHPSEPPEQPEGHEGCVIGIGRWSGGLVEVWLPAPWSEIDRKAPGQPWVHHAGRWYDITWLDRFPKLAAQLTAGDA